MICYSFYWAKTVFVSLMMISSITFEATCSGPVSDLFNSLIVGITSANEGEHSAFNQRPLELKLADAQMLQQWIGQIARKIVVEDGIFAGNYLCCPNININAVILTDGLPDERIKKIVKKLLKEIQNSEEKSQFLKLLFSFGAMLSAEIGEQSQQNGTLRALLKAYECVGGQFKGISDFVIREVIKSPIEQLKIENIILENHPSINLYLPYIHKFSLLNALNIEMSPNDVINFAFFIKSNFLSYPPINPFKKYILELKGLSVSNLDKDPVKYRRIAHQLLLYLKIWKPKDLEKIWLKKSDENAIKLTQREKCFFGIFTRNLMQRMAKFELLEDYFGELNISDLVNIVKIELEFYERLSAENCNEKSLPFFDEAIRIDWNVWKEIIQQIDVLSETIKRMDKNQKKLEEYLKSVEFKNAMQIIRAKSNEKKFGLELKADVKKKFYKPTPKVEIDEFCSKLAKIRQTCKENIEQYERKIPFKINVRIKQKENYNKFYDFVAIVVENCGGNSIKNDGKSIEFDLKVAKSFLEKVYNSATNQIVKKNESEEYKCLPKLNFETAIRAILNKNLNEKAQNLVKEFYVQKEFVKIPRKSAEKEGDLKHFLELDVEAQLFNLFFSFAARLEAIVHGKNIDGTIEKSRENSKDKIRAFLAVPNCFNVPEWANKFSIFDYWMEIKETNSKKSQMPVIGVAIFREIIKKNEKAKSISQENYKTLKALNEHKFSIYETTKLLRQFAKTLGHSTSSGLIPNLINKLINQMDSEVGFKWERKRSIYDRYSSRIIRCEYAKLFQNVSENFMKIKGVNLHMDEHELQIQKHVENGKYCKINEEIGERGVKEATIEFLNNFRYDLVVNFSSNARKNVHDRAEDLLEEWTGLKLFEENTFVKGNELSMMEQIYDFTKYNRENISKIEALKANEKDGFDLMGLFDKLDKLVRKFIDEEIPNLEKAKKELTNVKGKKQFKEKEKEIKTLEKKLEENKESAREMSKSFGQTLEEIKKHYGQAMDE